MTALATQIVHEAETQRQHVRVKLPIAIEIDGQIRDVIDWSVAGLAISDDGHLAPGGLFSGRLIFPLADVEFSLKVRCEIRYALRGQRRVGCRFVDMSPSDLATLQYLVGAYLSGELVRSGDILAIASRQNFTRARKQDGGDEQAPVVERILRKVRRAATVTAILAMAALLVGYILLAIYQRVFVSVYDGYVGSEQTVYARSPAIGSVSALNIQLQQIIAKDAEIGQVIDEQGRRLEIRSPCNCVAVASPVPAGSVVQRGTPLAVLAPQSAALSVTVRLPIEKASGAKVGNRVTIASFNGAAETRGTISRVDRFTPIEYQTERGAPELQSYVVLTVQSDRPLALTEYAEPVRVRLDRLQLFAGSRPTTPAVEASRP